MRKNIPYRLGIDVGVASVGIAAIALDAADYIDGSPILFGAVRTYPIPRGAEERRLKRGARRNNERGKRRVERLADLLVDHGIGHGHKKMPKAVLDTSPIKCRAMASREQVPLEHLSRALLHMADHRGSSAIRESDIEEDKEKTDGDQGEGAIRAGDKMETKETKENRVTVAGANLLAQEMKRLGFETYGQYLRWREKRGQSTRINRSERDDYAYYPSREMVRREFRRIWDKQAEYYPDILTPALGDRVENELFHQRSITAPETIDAVVHENSRKAAQKTPKMWSCIFGPISAAQGRAHGASENPPEANGTLGRAK